MHQIRVFPYFDAITLPHGDPQAKSDWPDERPTKALQQGETQTLAIVLAKFTGEAGATPEGETA